MGIKGDLTREKILSAAETLILQNGYSGSSIDEIISMSGITKGGFFYHFESKNDLAKNLIKRYLKEDQCFFDSLKTKAQSLVEDPLQQLLLFLNLMAEKIIEMPDIHPGCLVASFTYESNQLDDEVLKLNEEGMLSWRKFFITQLEESVNLYPLKISTPLEDIADMLSGIIEGGIILSKVYSDKTMLPNQILQYRNYIRLLFQDVK